MDYKLFFGIALMLLNINTARADLYLEISAEAGGDELISTNTTDSISAGGGIKLAIGVQTPVNYDGSTLIRLSAGYLFDNILAYNGEADFSAVTFDAMLINYLGPHALGVGLTTHLSPEYSDDVIGYNPEFIEYDDALGVVLQYSFQFRNGLELGARITDLTYESGSIKQDAGSIGIFLSNGF